MACREEICLAGCSPITACSPSTGSPGISPAATSATLATEQVRAYRAVDSLLKL